MFYPCLLRHDFFCFEPCVATARKKSKGKICVGPTTFQGGSDFTRATERPQNGGKMTGMDILEFRDINGPAPMPNYGTIG